MQPSGDGHEDLATIVRDADGLEPEDTAATLLHWLLRRLDASRCAIVPCAGGVAGAPLAFVASERGVHPDLRRVPRSVVAEVVRSRQPVVMNDVRAGTARDSSSTLERQGVRALMAVPVLARRDLVAVAYVDRLLSAEPFSRDDELAFHSLAIELTRPLIALRDEDRRRDESARPLGPAMRHVIDTAMRLAPHADVNLLVTGETGVGKEWLARLIHERSGRSGPFVPLNVNAVPETLFEAELMGTTRGAFTGAIDRMGAAELASGGTLFLDEIGDLALGLQVKLLRFIEDRKLVPVGGVARAVDLRIVAATNRPLEGLASEGAFRLDLAHRFARPLRIPPLRERPEEILDIARQSLAAKAGQRGLPVPRLTRGACDLLESHAWPGNVRQLQMTLSQAMLLCDGGVIDSAVLGPLLDEAAGEPVRAEGAGEGQTWAEFRTSQACRELDWARRHVSRNDGNVEAAARSAGCPASTLRSILKRHAALRD